MRFGLCASLLVSVLVVGGCACEHPTAFWWNTRLVPITGHEQVTTGTGATENDALVAMPPQHEVQPHTH